MIIIIHLLEAIDIYNNLNEHNNNNNNTNNNMYQSSVTHNEVRRSHRAKFFLKENKNTKLTDYKKSKPIKKCKDDKKILNINIYMAIQSTEHEA